MKNEKNIIEKSIFGFFTLLLDACILISIIFL